MMPHPDKRAVETQQVMSNFLNIQGSHRDFISLMAKDHRALQSSFTLLCIAWLERAAQQYKDGDFDPRTEDECLRAYQMISALHLQEVS